MHVGKISKFVKALSSIRALIRFDRDQLRYLAQGSCLSHAHTEPDAIGLDQPN